MAHPFAKWPTLEAFIRYAAKHDCEEKRAKNTLYGHRGPTKIRYLVGPKGDIAILQNLKKDEHLAPTVANSLCRQLKIPPIIPGL